MRERVQDSKFTVQQTPSFSYASLLASCASLFFVICIIYSGTAFGAEETGHAGEWKEWLWKILNFAILVAILVKFARKPLREFLSKRTEIIERSLREAQEARQLAEKALAEVQERLKLKDKEMEEILARTRLSAEKEQNLLIQQGEQMKEKILEQARDNIDYELRLAKEAIKAEAVEVAMELAEKKLKDKLTKEKQVRLIEESLRRMETKN